MGIRESALSTLSALTNSDFVRMVSSAGASRKISLQAIAQHIIEQYAGSSLLGRQQSVKSALDELNSTLFQNVSGNITADNIDTFTTRGIYSAYITATTILGTSGGNSYGLLIVSCPPTAQRIGQYLFLPSAGLYATRYNNGSAWSAWSVITAKSKKIACVLGANLTGYIYAYVSNGIVVVSGEIGTSAAIANGAVIASGLPVPETAATTVVLGASGAGAVSRFRVNASGELTLSLSAGIASGTYVLLDGSYAI